MSQTITSASLPPDRRQLLKQMQRINFGRIEGLVIANRQPVFDPPPQIIREVKFCAENGPRPEAAIDDFVLKAQVVELFTYIDEKQNGVIKVLEIKHGLPFRMEVENAA